MGYFRILYYISYIFNTITRILKRHGKFVLWFLAIFVFLFFTMYTTRSQAVYIQNSDYMDAFNTIKLNYDSMCIKFLQAYESNTDETLKQTIKNLFLNNSYGYYIYVGDSNGLSVINASSFSFNALHCVFYPVTVGGGISITTSTYTNYLGIKDNIYLYSTGSNWQAPFVTFNGNSGNIGYYSFNFYIPQSLLHYQNSYIYDYFYNNYDLQELELLYEMDTKLANIDENVEEYQNFVSSTPSSEDFSSEDLPSDSGVTDTTEDYTNTIFTDFYNTMTASYVGAVHDIDITIPFTNKTFKISGNYTKQYLPTALKDLISMFWYFAISILIYRDIMHKFNKIRSGDIEHVQDNNIKEDML